MVHPSFKRTPHPERFEDVFADYSFLIDPSSFRHIRSHDGQGGTPTFRVEYDRSAISHEGMFYAGVVLQRQTPLDQNGRSKYYITMGSRRLGYLEIDAAMEQMFIRLNELRPCTIVPRYSNEPDEIMGSTVELDDQHLMILRMIFKDYLPKLP